jgi:hypothetical protein
MSRPQTGLAARAPDLRCRSLVHHHGLSLWSKGPPRAPISHRQPVDTSRHIAQTILRNQFPVVRTVELLARARMR